MAEVGRVVILNGAPRSGKSSIVAAMQELAEEPWTNLGVDVFAGHVTPPQLRPGMGLRPGGGERSDIEARLPALYGAFYDSVAAHSRHGLPVLVDVGHHDAYAAPLGLLADAARRLEGLRAWLIGVRCPLETIVDRRMDAVGEGRYAPPHQADGRVAEAVVRWQAEVHRPGVYDLAVDTSVASPSECAARILRHLDTGPPPQALRTIARGD